MITAKDVRMLVRNAGLMNSVKPGHALVWRAIIERDGGLPTSVERRFLPDTPASNISWFMGGAHHAYASLGCELRDEELSVERV